MSIQTNLDKIQIYAKDTENACLYRREMTADDRETLVVYIGKANTVARPTHGSIPPFYEALNIP